MKTLIVVLFLFVTSLSYSQIKSTAYTTAGLEIDSKYQTTAINGMASIDTQYEIGDFSLGVVGMSYFKKEVPIFLGGSSAAWKFYRDPKNGNTVSISGRYLYGTEGEQLIGLGLGYEVINKVSILATGDWNYKEKTGIVQAGLGYTFATF